MTRTAVSLFAGVGGIDLALESAGFHVTSAVELNAAARGVLADRLPQTTLHRDVTEVTADDLRADGFVPERGLLAAGFPCQDLSVAGRRKGMGQGTRSGLYWHVVRLLADLRPRWVLLENVPGLLSAVCPCPGDGTCGSECPGELHTVEGGACGPGRCMGLHGGAMGAVTGSLGHLGYGFAGRVLDAQHFGVPQRRRRVILVGCLGDDRRPVEVLLEPESSVWDSASGDQARPGTTADSARGADPARVVSTLQGGGRRGHRVDAEAAAGGHLIPVTYQKVVRSGERDADGNLPPEVWAHRDVAATLNCGDNGSESRATELIVHPLAVRGRDGGAQIEVGPEGGPYNALRAGDGGSSRQSLVAISIDMRNAARESGTGVGTQGTGIAEEGDPSYTVTASSRAVPAIAYDMQNDLLGDVCSTLRAEAQMRQNSGAAVLTQTTVRRLTPRECERLQGFPDDWTATSNGKPQTDSPRYQQMGNAVAVPVFEWIARRIVESEAS